jgi:hypothetical protein
MAVLVSMFDQELTNLAVPGSSGFTMSTTTGMAPMAGDASGFRRGFALLQLLRELSSALRECMSRSERLLRRMRAGL